MKKVLGFLLVFTLIVSSGMALKAFSFDFTPEIGLVNGRIGEYVYTVENNKINNLESRLDWDISHIPYFGGVFETRVFDFIFLNLAGKYYIPKKSGLMRDYDWMNSLDPTELTNYSQHTNSINKFYSFDASLGISIHKNIVTFSPFIMFDASYILMDGTDGYYSYKSNNWEKKELSGKVISYEQFFYSGLLGLKFTLKPDSVFTFSYKFAFSPALTAVVAQDYHYLRDSIFRDEMFYGFYFMNQIEESLALNENERLGIKIEWNFLPTITGRNLKNSISALKNNSNAPWTKENVLGGTSRTLLSISINYTLSI